MVTPAAITSGLPKKAPMAPRAPPASNAGSAQQQATMRAAAPTPKVTSQLRLKASPLSIHPPRGRRPLPSEPSRPNPTHSECDGTRMVPTIPNPVHGWSLNPALGGKVKGAIQEFGPRTAGRDAAGSRGLDLMMWHTLGDTQSRGSSRSPSIARRSSSPRSLSRSAIRPAISEDRLRRSCRTCPHGVSPRSRRTVIPRISPRERPRACADLMKASRSRASDPYCRYPEGVRASGASNPMAS